MNLLLQWEGENQHRDEGLANSYADDHGISPSLGYRYVQYENVSFTQLFT